MDEFAIDLDKVLDEFEESENIDVKCASDKNAAQPAELDLDLSEADFAPACSSHVSAALTNGKTCDLITNNDAMKIPFESVFNASEHYDNGSDESSSFRVDRNLTADDQHENPLQARFLSSNELPSDHSGSPLVHRDPADTALAGIMADGGGRLQPARVFDERSSPEKVLAGDDCQIRCVQNSEIAPGSPCPLSPDLSSKTRMKDQTSASCLSSASDIDPDVSAASTAPDNDVPDSYTYAPNEQSHVENPSLDSAGTQGFDECTSSVVSHSFHSENKSYLNSDIQSCNSGTDVASKISFHEQTAQIMSSAEDNLQNNSNTAVDYDSFPSLSDDDDDFGDTVDRTVKFRPPGLLSNRKHAVADEHTGDANSSQASTFAQVEYVECLDESSSPSSVSAADHFDDMDKNVAVLPEKLDKPVDKQDIVGVSSAGSCFQKELGDAFSLDEALDSVLDDSFTLSSTSRVSSASSECAGGRGFSQVETNGQDSALPEDKERLRECPEVKPSCLLELENSVMHIQGQCEFSTSCNSNDLEESLMADLATETMKASGDGSVHFTELGVGSGSSNVGKESGGRNVVELPECQTDEDYDEASLREQNVDQENTMTETRNPPDSDQSKSLDNANSDQNINIVEDTEEATSKYDHVEKMTEFPQVLEADFDSTTSEESGKEQQVCAEDANSSWQNDISGSDSLPLSREADSSDTFNMEINGSTLNANIPADSPSLQIDVGTDSKSEKSGEVTNVEDVRISAENVHVGNEFLAVSDEVVGIEVKKELTVDEMMLSDAAVENEIQSGISKHDDLMTAEGCYCVYEEHDKHLPDSDQEVADEKHNTPPSTCEPNIVESATSTSAISNEMVNVEIENKDSKVSVADNFQAKTESEFHFESFSEIGSPLCKQLEDELHTDEIEVSSDASDQCHNAPADRVVVDNDTIVVSHSHHDEGFEEDLDALCDEHVGICDVDIDEFVNSALSGCHPDETLPNHMTASAPCGEACQDHVAVLVACPAGGAVPEPYVAARDTDMPSGPECSANMNLSGSFECVTNDAGISHAQPSTSSTSVESGGMVSQTQTVQSVTLVENVADNRPGSVQPQIAASVQPPVATAYEQVRPRSVQGIHPADAGSQPPRGLPPPYIGPPLCANIAIAITQLGKMAPVWMQDAEAPKCMQCDLPFSFTRRRHHCRACGKIFCNSCCNLKAPLQFLDNKEARVCSKCYQDLIRAQTYERSHPQTAVHSPNPNNPSEYCSTVPPQVQAMAGAGAEAAPLSVMVPTGVLRKQGSIRNSVEPKQVMFSDGIRPGGDLTELDGVEAARAPTQSTGRKTKKVDKSAQSAAAKTRQLLQSKKAQATLIPDSGFPPILTSELASKDVSVHENPSAEFVLQQIENASDSSPVAFALNRNLHVFVRITELSCCMRRKCWCFTTKGLCTVGQDELVILLECQPDEKVVPADVFRHIAAVYDQASQGTTVTHLSHMVFQPGSLGSHEVGGYLFIRQSYQCIQQLVLPEPPYLFAILLQKWELPWARVFPLRLLLRLGAEFRYYPCPLVSVRSRKPVYGEIGHTIMNLLADFHNYQYALPQISGLLIHMEDKRTSVQLPRNRYELIMKVLNNSDDHVMAFGASFSSIADSHLVCLQNDDGNYQTQAINIQNRPRQVTGACFIVFNGALKTSSGLNAKSSIVEDGLMVQITAESMVELKQALRNMKDYVISCGSITAPQPDEVVAVEWVADERNANAGVKSPVDGMSLHGVDSIRVHSATDYVGNGHAVRWTELFLLSRGNVESPTDPGSGSTPARHVDEPADISRLADQLAQAFCLALTPHLEPLAFEMLTKIGLRVTVGTEQVGYEVGSGGSRLPDFCMNDLDEKLIPVINTAVTPRTGSPLVLELVFHILFQSSVTTVAASSN